MSWNDRQNSYGWVSIFLHWLAASLIIALWIVGDSIDATKTNFEKVAQLKLHISIGSCAFVFLWLRVIWRLKSQHPKLDDQGRIDHYIANTVHYLMLTAIALMLISGPLMVWSGGRAISVFDLFSIPSPLGNNDSIRYLTQTVHVYTSKAILTLVILHICGAFKHLMFNDDDVFLRILMPKREK